MERLRCRVRYVRYVRYEDLGVKGKKLQLKQNRKFHREEQRLP